MRKVTVTYYTFDELDDKAKSHALESARNNLPNDWWEPTIDMAEEVASMLGISARERVVKLYDGGTRLAPSIYFSGFCNQGDGAHFTGTYAYKHGALAKVVDELPKETRIHDIARALQRIQRKNFYQLEATVKHSGHYNHEYCTNIEVSSERGSVSTEDEIELRDILREFMRWIYTTLESEYEYQTSDEQLAENIRENELEFTANGTLV